MAAHKFRIEIDPQSLVPNDSVRKYYWWTVGLILALVGLIAGLWQYLPQVVPMFFTEPWGEARLAPKIYLWLLPIISFSITVVNIILGKTIPSNHKILNYALGVGALATAVMMLVGFYGIAQSLI